jgi:HlyD family secretion protein
MARMVKVILALMVLAVAVVGAHGWIREGDAQADGLKLVEVTTGAITEKAVAVGQIEPRLKFHVKSKMSGIVRRCAVEVGDTVRPGDVLFDIVPDPTPAELLDARRQVESARTRYNLAKVEQDRAAELGRQGILPRGQLDERVQAFEQARISLEQAEDVLELIRKGRVTNGASLVESMIRAPAGGTVLERKVNPGDPVVPLTSYQAGTELATIADMNDMIFKGTVDEIDVGKLQMGLAARLKIGALPDATVTGKVSRIAPQGIERNNARLFEVEIRLDPTEVLLRAGYSATADLVIREKKEALIIPERLVLFEDQGRSTYVEVPGDAESAPPRKVPIKTGLSDGLSIEIVEGLRRGDKVVERPPREIASPF